MHNLERNTDGTYRFVYADHINPWHRLGTSVVGAQDADTMLTLAKADYPVRLHNVAAVDENGNLLHNPDGTPVIIEDSRATVRVNEDGSFDPLATVGTRYSVRQNREVLERALAVVGASSGDAVVETLGVLAGGRRFFATINLGNLIIDPSGVNDKIGRYLVCSSGHDGVWPIRYANTDIRAVCENTVVMGLQTAQRVFTARHTKNVDTALEDARTVLNLSVDWALEFQQTAERMLGIDVPRSGYRIDKILDSVFKPKLGETNAQQSNRQQVQEVIRTLYGNEKNGGSYGFNGWSIYNAIVEYLDHYRKATPDERAAASIDDTSWVTRKKLDAQQAVLSFVS